MSNIEKLKRIIADAPEGATHCTDTVPSMNLYAKVEHLGGFYVRLSNRWESYPIYAGIHLLDDLREIQRLRAENEALKHFKLHMLELAKNHNCDSITRLATKCSKQDKRIAELEEKLSFYESIRAESQGVSGFHLNGDIATWDKLEQSE